MEDNDIAKNREKLPLSNKQNASLKSRTIGTHSQLSFKILHKLQGSWETRNILSLPDYTSSYILVLSVRGNNVDKNSHNKIILLLNHLIIIGMVFYSYW